jgi:hypothetical protein
MTGIPGWQPARLGRSIIGKPFEGPYLLTKTLRWGACAGGWLVMLSSPILISGTRCRELWSWPTPRDY